MRQLVLLLALVMTGVVSTLFLPNASAAQSTAATAPHIVMYTTQSCGYCAKARAWFKDKGLDWDERDIETSASANNQFKTLGGQGTPLIVIDGKAIHGFHVKAIEAALAQRH